jgi:hypothetical protein
MTRRLAPKMGFYSVTSSTPSDQIMGCVSLVCDLTACRFTVVLWIANKIKKKRTLQEDVKQCMLSDGVRNAMLNTVKLTILLRKVLN